jgi:hypothetical protein
MSEFPWIWNARKKEENEEENEEEERDHDWVPKTDEEQEKEEKEEEEEEGEEEESDKEDLGDEELSIPACDDCQNHQATEKCWSCNKSVCIRCTYRDALCYRSYNAGKHQNDVEMIQRCSTCRGKSLIPHLVIHDVPGRECCLQ